MIQTDLREFLAAVDAAGQLKKVNDAHWDKEMGAVTEVLYREKVDQAPALLFDQIPGYPKGMRCLYGMLGSPARLALALGMEARVGEDRMSMLNSVRRKMANHEPIAPRTVTDSPVLENIVEGDDVDMFDFPVPVHHEADGGRYIGTACGVITRDPDSGRVNMGTYRVQAIGANKATSYISNGKQGLIQRDKYLAAGKPCPMAIVIGIDPVSFLAARYTLPDSVCEFDWAGALSGKPLDVLEGELTGLPFPAGSEIVMEGEVSPDETTEEGPFGEWHGYYAGGARPEPVITIKRIYHRSDPILTCAASQKPPHSHLFERCFLRSAGLWDSLDNASVP